MILPLLVLFGTISASSATCYYRNGTVAVKDTPCAGSNMCCPQGDSCMDNGICRDKNNFPNGTKVTFPDGDSYNYTGLYMTSSCQDKSYQGCTVPCTSYSSSSAEYMWSCNTALTSFCCHNDSVALGQGDCCDSGTISLPSPRVLGASSSSASPSSTTTSLSSTGTAASASQTSSTPSPTPQPSNSLSTGAKAGIGVGVAAAGIIIITLLALLYRARQRGRSGPGTVEPLPLKTELEASQTLPAQGIMHELSPDNRVFELGS